MLETITNDLVLRMDNLAGRFGTWVGEHLVNVVVLLGAAWIARRIATELMKRLIKHAVRPDVYPTKSDREKRIKTLHSLASGIIRLTVYLITIILIIGEINPRLTTVLFASAGLIGVAFGFGAQTLIRDLVTGIFIIIENQYRIGDEVTLTAGGGIGTVSGTVEDLSIRTTVLRDLNGNVHHMPNGNVGLTSNKTLGYSRLNENLVVAMGTDMIKLEQAIRQVGESLATDPDFETQVLEPPTLTSILSLDENSITVRVSAKTSPATQRRVRSEFYRRLKEALVKHKIKLAGPTQTSEEEV